MQIFRQFQPMGRRNKQRQIRKGWELPRGVAPIAEAPVDRVRKGSRNAATDRRPVIGCSQDVPMQEYRGGAGFDSGVISPVRFRADFAQSPSNRTIVFCEWHPSQTHLQSLPQSR